MSSDDKTGPYKREGEIVGGTARDETETGSVTFGTVGSSDKPLHRQKNVLFYLCEVQKKTTSEIADELDVATVTIQRWLNRFGLSRSISEGRRLAQLGSHRPWESEKWLRDQRSQGKSIQQIADEQGISTTPIENSLKENDLNWSRLGLLKHRQPKLADSEWLRQQYVEQSRSAPSIADELGVSRDTLYYHLERHGIDRRSYEEVNLLRHGDCAAVHESRVPRPPNDINQEQSQNNRTTKTTTNSGQASYTGPDIGIDLSWSDSSPTTRKKWIPYRNHRWLDWQYNELDVSVESMASLCEVSAPTITSWMDRFGIERDPPNNESH